MELLCFVYIDLKSYSTPCMSKEKNLHPSARKKFTWHEEKTLRRSPAITRNSWAVAPNLYLYPCARATWLTNHQVSYDVENTRRVYVTHHRTRQLRARNWNYSYAIPERNLLHAQKSFLNLVTSNQNYIVITLFWSIWHQIKLYLVSKQSEESNYNLSLGLNKEDSEKISLCAYIDPGTQNPPSHGQSKSLCPLGNLIRLYQSLQSS